MMKKSRCAAGFSLLESFLAVGISAVFFIFVINIGRDIAQQQAIKAAAAYVNTIDKAVAQLLGDPANFATLYADLSSQTGAQRQIEIADLKSGFLTFPANPVLGASFPATGPYNQTFSIIFRIRDNLLITTDNQVIETYIASRTRVDNNLLPRIAAALGGKGGAWRDANGDVGTGTIRAAFGAWTASVNNLAATTWYTAVTTTPPTTTDGGYVVAYNYYDQKRIAKDYLYRTQQTDTSLNRMEGNLVLNGYNVLGADNVHLTGALTSDELQAQNNMDITGPMNVTGNLQADGNTTIGGQLSASDPIPININGGNSSGALTVVGTATLNNSIIDGPAIGDGNLSTLSLTSDNAIITENMIMSTGTLDTRSVSYTNIGVSGTGITSTGLLTVGKTLQANQLTTRGVVVNSGNTGAVDVKTTGNTSFGGKLTADTVAIGGQARVGNSDWRCGSGC